MTFPSRHDPTHLFFVTAAVCGWKHLFSPPCLLNPVHTTSLPATFPAPPSLPAPSPVASSLPGPSSAAPPLPAPSSANPLLPAPSSAQVANPYVLIILDSLSWMQAHERMLLFAFVLMPSHLHLILKPCTDTIGGILQDFGSHTAHSIIKQLQTDHEAELLRFFHEQRRDKRHEHSIWQDIQAKNIFSANFLFQKLEYLHSNPARNDWRLVDDRADFPYSSACFYDRGRAPIIEVTNLREWLCVDPPPGTAA